MDMRIRHFVVGDEAAVLAIAAAADAVDRAERGMAAGELDEWLHEPELDTERDVFVAEWERRPVGYVFLFPRGTCIGAVHPGYRRRRVGTRLMQAAEERARERADHEEEGASINVMCRSSQRDLMALCERLGLHAGRSLVRMLRDLHSELPDIAPPAGMTIHPYAFGNDTPLLDALNEVFDDDPMTVEQWSQIGIGLPHFWPELWFLAWEDRQLAGFALNRIDPAWIEYSHRQEGEIDELGVRKPWRGRGIAAAMVSRSLFALRESGMDWAYLNVNALNTPAIRLYERMGFYEQRRNTTFRKYL